MEPMTKKRLVMPEIKPELIAAVKLYFLAQAWTKTVRPVVEGYQRKILAIMQPINTFDGTIITEPKHAYSMSDEDFKIYADNVNDERIKAKLEVPDPEYCPLLMAESAESDAENKVIQAAEYFTTCTPHQILCTGMANYHKMSEAVAVLVVSYCKNNRINLNILQTV